MSDQDREHLKLLGIFHYVFGGLAFVGALVPIIHLVLGILLLSGNLSEIGKEDEAQTVGVILVIFASVVILLGITFAILVLMAGRNLMRYRHRTYCLVIAALSCLAVPLGTVLGVFTILVLMRDSVKQLFEQAEAGA